MRNLLLALPPALVTIALAIVGCSELAGAHALTMGEPRSAPEAIAMRDYAGAARLLEAGEGVDTIGLIRKGVLADQPVLASPLETAVMVDAVPMIDFLIARGVDVSDQLKCLAADVGAGAAQHRLGPGGSCRPGAMLQLVLDRP